jgi:hypothetical protein
MTKIVIVGQIGACFDQRADGVGAGVENIDFMSSDHLPEAGRVRITGDALEHDLRRAHRKRAVRDIGMARYPAHVGGTPVDVIGT